MEGVHGTHKASKLASGDAISNMPDNVMTNIMNHLPIRDAIRTSILARNWRLKWTLLTQLAFDYEFSWSLLPLEPKGKKYYKSRIISRLLLLLRGPVTKFVLYILRSDILDVGDFNYWVLFLSRKGIKEFTLVNSDDNVPLQLPTHLCSCLELTHLTLENCLFTPAPAFHGFPNLLSLRLCMVHFESGNYGEIITRSPLLEILEISLSCSNHHISKIYLDDIAKLRNLKKLLLPLRELQNTVITPSSIFQFLGFLPKLEDLCLDFLFCKFVVEAGARKCVPTAFRCLKILTLFGIDFGSGSMLSYAFRMIWGSLNLLELRIYMPEFTGAYEFYSPPTTLLSSDLDSNRVGQLQLQSVVIEHFTGSHNEISLMKYLLAYSPFLKTVAIHSDSPLAPTKKLMVAMMLLKLHRASPIAQVDFY